MRRILSGPLARWRASAATFLGGRFATGESPSSSVSPALSPGECVTRVEPDRLSNRGAGLVADVVLQDHKVKVQTQEAI